MLARLDSSDLAAIRDLAIARGDLRKHAVDDALHPPLPIESRADWREFTTQLLQRIGALPLHAQAELLALVWLGRGHGGDWNALLDDARAQNDTTTPGWLATQPQLDAYIDRGLLVLAERKA